MSHDTRLASMTNPSRREFYMNESVLSLMAKLHCEREYDPKKLSHKKPITLNDIPYIKITISTII